MSTNKNSIHILRGTKPGVNSTTLYDGQLYFDRGTKTLQVGDKSNSTIGNNNNYVTVKDGAINDAKVASNAAIKGSKLADASNDESNRTGITTAKIENSAITGLKIADGSISDSKVASDADINGTKFKDNSISGSKLHDADGSSGITTGKIENNAITTEKIVDDAITTDKILDNAITPEKLQATGDFNAHSFSSKDDNIKYHADYRADRIIFNSTAKDSDGQVTLVPSIAVGQTVMLGLPSVDGTLATAEEIESGEIVAKTAQNATNAQKTDFSNAEWILHDTNADKVSVNYGESYEIITYGGKFFDDYSVSDIAPTVITIPPASMWNKTRGCGFILSTTTGALMGESNIIRFEEHMILIDRDLKMAYGCYVKKWNFSTDTWESEWTTQNGKFSYRRIR